MGETAQVVNQYKEPVKPQQPLPVDSIEAQELVSQTDSSVEYKGKEIAGAVATIETVFKPIVGEQSGRVGSYWGNQDNLVYSTQNRRDASTFVSVTETAGSADAVIRDSGFDLEEMFETQDDEVKRFILKITDTTGASLYGWIGGIAESADVYTIDVYNDRLSVVNQNWVGTLASFDNTSLAKAEIFRYDGSLVFGTGTAFTEEVQHPKEYASSWKEVMEAVQGFSNGQYCIDYMRGLIIGVRASTTASEDLTYNIWASAVKAVSGGSDTNLIQLGGETLGDHGSTVIDHGIQPLYEAKDFDGSALPNAVTEGQAARPASTLSGIPFAFLVNEDGSKSPIATDDSAQVATPDIVNVGGEYRASATTYADGDAVINQYDVNGNLKVTSESAGNAPQAYGVDAAGADTYTTVVTASADRHNMHVSLKGSNDAIISIDSGTTDHYYIVAGSTQVFDDILISNTATVQGKNASAGNNYTNLTITIW